MKRGGERGEVSRREGSEGDGRGWGERMNE